MESPDHGRRNASQVRYGVVNQLDLFASVSEVRWTDMLPNPTISPVKVARLYAITDTVDFVPGGGVKSLVTAVWKQYRPFVFQSGFSTPPKLLRTRRHLSQSTH